MEPFNAGWLSLLPPAAAIVAALISREVISALLVGIFTGAVIYTSSTGGGVIIGSLDAVFSMMVSTLEFKILIFTSLLGAVVYLVSLSGGSKAYGEWAGRRMKTKRKSLLSACGLGCLVFIDDYFSCLFVGTVMKPLTDRCRVARAKLAWIVDSTAAPVCIIAPVSSWAAAVTASLKSTPLEDQSMAAFMAAIPWNFYALLTIALGVFLIWRGRDFGPMLTAEAEAEKTENLRQDEEQTEPTGNGGLLEMIFPIALLLIFSFAALLYSGGFWSDGPTKYQFGAAIGASSSSSALCWAGFGTLVATMLLYLPRGVLSFTKCMDGAVNGIKLMLPANIILILAWTLSGVCRQHLSAPQFMQPIVTASGMRVTYLPEIVFAIAAFLAFSMGTAWGTFGILLPIVTYVFDPASELFIIGVSACLAGAVVGDHCSPISDTTIMASAGAMCNHVNHVSTQLPYAATLGIICFVNYILAGFIQNVYISLAIGVVLVIATLFVFRAVTAKKPVPGFEDAA